MTMKFGHEPHELLADMSDGILVLTINRQASHNSWTQALRDELTRRMLEADKDDSVHAVVITAAGTKAFCAGQDLAEIEVFHDGSEIQKRMDRLVTCYDAVRNIGKPLVAAVNGVAAGSGFQLTQFCDYVVAHEGVRMGQTEVISGLPSVFGTWLMSERIGMRAYELSLQGRLMTAEEAKELGFVNEVVVASIVLHAALRAARRFAQQSRYAFRMSKAANRRFEQERYVSAMQMAVAAWQEAFDAGAPQKEIGHFFEESRAKKGAARTHQ